jgi:quinol monooxygenase YgiN
MFALVVRFYLRDEDAAKDFDKLTEEMTVKIQDNEPDTVIYAVHKVKDAPLSRIFYELYESRAAFDAHEQQEHTRRFLDERGRYLTGARVEFLEPPTGKGVIDAAQ